MLPECCASHPINMIRHIIYVVLVACKISHGYGAILPTVTSYRMQPEKLSIVTDWNEYNMRETDGPGTYSFGYDVEDAETGNIQFRSEEKFGNGSVIGSYGYVTPEGNVHMVHYVADHLGYRTKIEEGRKPLLKNKFRKSPFDEVSPQMNAALQSLENYNRYQKVQEQRVRPIDKAFPPTNQLGKRAEENRVNYELKKNNYFNEYYVPANRIYN